MKVESLRSIFPPERERREKKHLGLHLGFQSRFLASCLREKIIQNTRQKKKTNEGADEKNEEYYNEPGRVVLPNTHRDQVLPDHVVFNYRRVRVRGTFLEEVLLFSLSLFVISVVIILGAFLASNLCLLTFFKR
jgi:hypothetical protein